MLYESELKVMDLLWTYGDSYASELAKKAMEMYGWNKNTTYTVIKKLIEKQYIKRTDPKFFCSAMVAKDQEQVDATQSLIDRLYKGSISTFFSHFVSNQKLSQEEIDKILNAIKDSKD